MKILLIALAFVVLILVLLRRRNVNEPAKTGKKDARKKLARKKKTDDIGQDKRFRSTVIHCKSDACEAAKALARQPYLDRENTTPLLPLPDCDAPRCQCTYRHINDRREEGERRLPSGMSDSMRSAQGEEERRSVQRGRRSED